MMANKQIAVDFDPFEGQYSLVERVVQSTEAQRELWNSCAIGGNDANLAYNESITLKLYGEADVRVLKIALEKLIERNEALRGSFNDDGTLMIISQYNEVEIRKEDLSRLTDENANNVISDYVFQEAKTAFDLLNGPLLRLAIFKKSVAETLLVITAHHIVCDGWSFGVFLEELSGIYNALKNNTKLPPSPLKFSDYAVCDYEFQYSKKYKEVEDYWLNAFRGALPNFELPPDFSRPSVRTYKSGFFEYALPKEAIDPIKKYGAQYGSSLVNTLMCAFEVLLYKYSNNNDVVLALATAGQSATEMYNLIGHCVNSLPLRNTLCDEISFPAYLKSRKSKMLEDIEHQQFTFGTLLKRLNIPRDVSRIPLVPVSFNIDIGMDANVSFDGLLYEIIYNARVCETFEVFLNIAESKSDYLFQWSYNTQLYRRETIEKLMNYYIYIINQVIAVPEILIRDICLEDEAVVIAALKEWNKTSTPFPDKTVIELFEEIAKLHPDKKSIGWKGSSLSFGELNQKANQLAYYLVGKSVKNGEVVGVMMDRRPELLICILAIMKTGAAFLPLDPNYPAERAQMMLADAGSKFLVCGENYSTRFNSNTSKFIFEDIERESKLLPVKNLNTEISADELVYVLFTSGSTGKPKGVMIANHTLVNYISWAAGYYLAKEQTSVFPLYTSVSFDLTMTSIFLPLLSGNCIEVYADDKSQILVETILAEGIANVIKLTPSHLALLNASEVINTGRKGALKFIVGGEDFKTGLAHETYKKFGPDIEIYNEYGPTEATIGCMIYKFRMEDEYPSVPIGTPISNARIYLLNKFLKPVSKGIAGEMFIGGGCLAKGYINRPDLTTQKFIDDPFYPGNKMYRTGDIAVFTDNGILHYKGRNDEMVKVQGYRIELGEIDYQLSRLPDVKEAVTIVREETPGEQRLVSYIVTNSFNESQTFQTKWKDSLRAVLPEYMVPAAFVLISKMPLTTNGKIDKTALPRPALPKSDESDLVASPVEKFIAKIWSQIFVNDKITVNSNFFDLGGHSLLAVQLMRKLEKATGLKLPVTTVLRYPVLKDLALSYSNISLNPDIQSSPEQPKPAEEEESGPASFYCLTEAQSEIWQACQVGGDGANLSYNLSHADYLEGFLNKDALIKAIDTLIQRNESLRCSISEDGDVINISSTIQTPLRYEDLSTIAILKEREENIADLINQNTSTVFNLEEAPLIRFLLVKLSDTKHLFCFSVHHIICDGTSFDIILKELSFLYNAYKKNEDPVLPRAIGFSHYAAAQQLMYKSEKYEESKKYWTSQFSGGVPVLNMPTDYDRPEKKNYKCDVETCFFSTNLTTRLQDYAKKANCSLTVLLRTIFEILLQKYTGQQEFVVGLPVSHHPDMAQSDSIGHFVNMLPVKCFIDENLSFTEFLDGRKQKILNDYEHRQFTFGSLIRHIRVVRSRSRNTMISVSFGTQLEREDISLDFDGLKHSKPEPDKIQSYDGFEISVNTFIEDGCLSFRVYYDNALFKRSSILKMMRRFEYLGESLVGDPHVSIRLQPFEDAADQENALTRTAGFAEKDGQVERNNTFKTFPAAYLPELFEAAVNEFGENLAVECDGESITYTALNVRVNQLAHYLLKSGMKKGDVVAVLMERAPDMVIALLAVLKCGATYLPLDPDFPRDRIDFMLRHSGAAFSIINKKFSGRYSSGAREVIIDELTKHLSNMPESNPVVKIEGEDIIYIIYTSGSTGKPKGVMIRHRNFNNFILSTKNTFQPDESTRLLAVTTISFEPAAVELFLPLISGSVLVLAGQKTTRDGELLLKKIINDKINFIHATPVTFRMLLDSGWNEKLPLTILSGGEPLTKALADELLERCKYLYNDYGPTETTIWSTLAHITNTNSPITIGKPICNTQIYIVDEQNNLLPDGSIGEICIGGESVGAGYLNNNTLTSEKFIDPPYSIDKKNKVYKTGDLGKILPDGNILCLGRNDQQIKIRGFRIEPGEVEYQVNQLPGIKESVCISKQDQQGEKILCCYFLSEAQGNAAVSKAQMMDWRNRLRETLPQYMIPGEFIRLEEFPLTPNRKIDRNKLQQLKTEGAEASGENEKAEDKEVIRKIWESELNITDITDEDDFFDLGGHSMIAVKVMRRIKKETGVKLPISSLFDNPTVGSLYKALRQSHYSSKNIVVPIKQKGKKRPVFIIHAGGLNILLYKPLGEMLDKDQPVFGLQGLGLDGDLTDLQNMQTIAARYLQEIKQYQPEGPYILLGYSLGGIIAFEMSHQLISGGEQVSLLGILDTHTKENASVPASRYLLKKTIRQFKKLVHFGKAFLQNPAEVYQYQKLVFLRKYYKGYVDKEDEQVYDYSREVLEAYWAASDNYVFKPLDIEVDLFRVDKRLYFLDDPKYLGWRKYATKGVNVYPIPGDHKTFLLPPNNEIAAKAIQRVINSKER